MRIATLLALAACAAAVVVAPAGAATKSVLIENFSFTPKKQTIAKGDKVRFDWGEDGTDHNVTFRKVPKNAKKPKRCGSRDTGSCKRKFGKTGVYRYVCTIHVSTDNMRGRIVVE